MLQQSRTIKGILVLWGLSLAVVIAGCGGGEDNTASINQEIPPNVASPATVSNKGFIFSTGVPFHIDAMLGEVTLFFGDFQSTNSAPFTLVAGGFRATGRAAFLNIYTLSVQESTFPTAQPPPLTQPARGPQVGDQLFIDINTTPQAQEVSVPVTNGVRDFTHLTLIGSPIQVSRTCDTKTGEEDVDLGTLVPRGPGNSGGCITVNGSINVQERNLSDTFKLTLQPADQIVQFILTFPTSTADDGDIDFDFFIRRKDKPNITDNTNVLQSCVSISPGQEACSIVLQQTDFAAGSPLPIEIQVQSAVLTSGEVLGTGNYTLEILSSVSPEVGNRMNICPNTGPGTIPEQEPNGRDVVNPSPPPTFLTDPDPLLFQGVGTLRVNGCLPIRGGHIGAAIIDAVFNQDGDIINQAVTDGLDNYEFSVEDTVATVAFLLNPTNLTDNAFSLFIDEPIPPTTPGGTFTFNRLAECATTNAFSDILPGTPVITCAVAVPQQSRNLRVGVFSSRVCPTSACTIAESDYSLDIIAVAQRNISVNPIQTPKTGGSLITPVPPGE